MPNKKYRSLTIGVEYDQLLEKSVRRGKYPSKKRATEDSIKKNPVIVGVDKEA